MGRRVWAADDAFMSIAEVPVATAVLYRVCGWCARVRLDSWVSAEEATTELGLTGGRAARLSHGICETCARELKALGQRAR